MTSTGMNFASDNVTPAAPEVIEAVIAANADSHHSYGEDPYTRRLETLASAVFETDVAIFPVTTGTAANALALATLTPPYGAVYCHETAHVMTDECGAPEFFTGGAKLIGLPGRDGKLLPAQLEAPLQYAADTGRPPRPAGDAQSDAGHRVGHRIYAGRSPCAVGGGACAWPGAFIWTAPASPTPSRISAAVQRRSPGKPGSMC